MFLISLEVIKELPMTMILRPLILKPLQLRPIFMLPRFTEAAALPSLFLLWSTILILFSSRYILSKKN